MKKEDFVYMYILNGGEVENYGRGMDNPSVQEVASRKWKETKEYLQQNDYQERMNDLSERVWEFIATDDFNLELEPQ